MKRFSSIIVILLLVIFATGCGTDKSLKLKEQIDMPWGKVDLFAGWKIDTRDGNNLVLSNIDEQHLKVSFKMVSTPSNMKTWATSYAISTGRTPGGSGHGKVSGKQFENFITHSKVGKVTVEEKLYLIPFDENSLSIVTAIPTESEMEFHITHILDSVEVE